MIGDLQSAPNKSAAPDDKFKNGIKYVYKTENNLTKWLFNTDGIDK